MLQVLRRCTHSYDLQHHTPGCQHRDTWHRAPPPQARAQLYICSSLCPLAATALFQTKPGSYSSIDWEIIQRPPAAHEHLCQAQDVVQPCEPTAPVLNSINTA